MQKKVGIFIGRLNPPHLGHFSVIKKALAENDYLMLFLGSSNLINEKNPFSFIDRKQMLKLLFDNKNLIIESLDDFHNDIDWINTIKTKINIYFDKKDIFLKIYGGDLKNDYAIKILKKYKKEFKFELKFIEISRKKIIVQYKGQNYLISSSKIREALKNKDLGLIKKMVKKQLINYIV